MFLRSRLGGSFALLNSHAAEGKKTDLTASQALDRLKQGNVDFLADKPSVKTSRDSDRRLELARSQVPFAVLVGCSDSRVSPELLFDTGLGAILFRYASLAPACGFDAAFRRDDAP
jgi:carbonic anhydrase